MSRFKRYVRPVLLPLLAVLLGCVGLIEHRFAGWVKGSVNCSVFRRVGKSEKEALIPPGIPQRLHEGDQVRVVGSESATLVMYGLKMSLSPSKAWFTIPSTRPSSQQAEDLYRKYIALGGLPRGDTLTDEALWRALNLTDLENPMPSQMFKTRLRIVPVTARDVARHDVPMLNGMPNLKSNDKIFVEVANDSQTPLYLSLMDIDCTAEVDRLFPMRSGENFRLPGNSGWKRLPSPFWVRLPGAVSTGLEHFVLIATTNPIDTSILVTQGAVSFSGEVDATQDPLIYLLKAASESGRAEDPGKWTTAKADFMICTPG